MREDPCGRIRGFESAAEVLGRQREELGLLRCGRMGSVSSICLRIFRICFKKATTTTTTNNIFIYFALLVSKGNYHHWICFSYCFQGALANGRFGSWADGGRNGGGTAEESQRRNRGQATRFFCFFFKTVICFLFVED